jgi:hypothetical protein
MWERARRLLIIFCALAVSACGRWGEAEGDRERVISHLRLQHPFPNSAIKKEITPEAALSQVEEQWTKVMANLRSRLEERGLGNRQDILRGKQQVFDSWKKEFSVLAELSRAPGAKLHRYDEGPEGGTGFVVIQDQQQEFWLHLKFNRERDEY